jgi:hypothetical protein
MLLSKRYVPFTLSPPHHFIYTPTNKSPSACPKASKTSNKPRAPAHAANACSTPQAGISVRTATPMTVVSASTSSRLNMMQMVPASTRAAPTVIIPWAAAGIIKGSKVVSSIGVMVDIRGACRVWIWGLMLLSIGRGRDEWAWERLECLSERVCWVWKLNSVIFCRNVRFYGGGHGRIVYLR